MNEKFKNKYRIASARLQEWDYGWNGAYFVTICTQNRERFFGDITDRKIQLSEIGEMAKKYWLEIPEHFPFVKLDSFVVMPNHIHGIIVIDKPDDGRNNDDALIVEMQNVETQNAETQNFASLQQCQLTQPPSKNKFGPQSNNLASIIRGFKIGVTQNAKKINPNFKWQPRFYDHIIRNEKSYYRIAEYIINNPLKWQNDSYYDK